jgi:hypothetical protein
LPRRQSRLDGRFECGGIAKTGLQDFLPGAADKKMQIVAEVACDRLQRERFHHVTRFRRWRRGKNFLHCAYAQLEVVPPEELKRILESNS